MAEKGLFRRMFGGADAPADPATAEATPPPEAPPAKQGWLQRLKSGLSRSSNALSQSIAAVFVKRKLDEEMLYDFEDMLVRSDLGLDTAARIANTLRDGRYDREVTEDEVKGVLA